MMDIGALLKKPTFLLKFVEVLIAILCTYLIVGNLSICWTTNSMAAVYGTLIAYSMIGIIGILSYFLGPQMNKVLKLLINATAFIMFITAGGLMCNFYITVTYDPDAHKGKLLGSGLLAFFNAAVYAVDAFFTYKTQDETMTLPS